MDDDDHPPAIPAGRSAPDRFGLHLLDEDFILSRTLVRHVLARLCNEVGFSEDRAVSVVFCTSREIRRLKHRHFGIRKSTDVIAFSTDFPEVRGPLSLLGEIWICPSQVRSNALGLDRTFDEELLFVLAHGLLHLLGEDDSTAQGQQRMFRRQQELVDLCRDGRRRLPRLMTARGSRGGRRPTR